jgi:quinol monooxygenase YgiN
METERGCLFCGYYQDVKNENDFLIVEEWANQKDSDDHLRSDIFTVLVGAGSLMQQPPEIMIHTVRRSTVLEVHTPKSHNKKLKELNNENLTN